MFSDLLMLGLQPNKSLIMELPNIPKNYFNFFLRGYFDGDGCVNIYQRKDVNSKVIQVIFVSGSNKFLYGLSKILTDILDLRTKTINKIGSVFKISYKAREAVKLLSFIYENLDLTPYLRYKYDRYMEYLNYNNGRGL